LTVRTGSSRGINGLGSSGTLATYSPLTFFLKESMVVAPADMLAVLDYEPAFDDDNDGDYHPDVLYAWTLTGSHHNGRANGVFCDAHVEFARTNAWKAARARWNYDHQPHPNAYPYIQ
jgi:prepilin-type processing-associated H-X9-DG protein